MLKWCHYIDTTQLILDSKFILRKIHNEIITH